MTAPAVVAAYQRRIGTRAKPVIADIHHPDLGWRDGRPYFTGEVLTSTLADRLLRLGYDRIGVRVAKNRIADFTTRELTS